jgi:hypothetical protein
METGSKTEQRGWRPDVWLAEAGYPFSLPVLYKEIKAGRLEACKAGRATIILTSPAQYYARLPRELGGQVADPWARKRTATA